MKKTKKINKIIGNIITYTILIIVALTMLIPFIWMAATSLMDKMEVFSYPPKFIPDKPLWSNYKNALTLVPFGRYFLNSAIMVAVVVPLQLLVCSLAAYSLARIKFPGRNVVFWMFLSTMMIPGIVTLIPSFLIVRTLGWIDTYWALTVPMFFSVWGTFLLRQFFLTLPVNLEDAARIDGASEFRIFWKIILPLSKPALATLGIFSFMGTWQSFMWPLLVTREDKMRTVEVGVASFKTMYETNWPYQMAAAVVVMIPVIIVFLVAQKYFVKGIALTGMKE
ncbi:MAG: carbohydrate ABC transporter permease [Kosmotoga sp.]|uniref:carbohydrate ABC transporter permease n=1 Tax=Kosmotoga sp. TaxID=1955248 RepID=UPI001DF60CA4|nr:carbohydrate ABC transporter permease [Kosmotoga sp.]MBO8166717.1 carbohydrate ABC transporter permease [Kosmotoga sp.]